MANFMMHAMKNAPIMLCVGASIFFVGKGDMPHATYWLLAAMFYKECNHGK